MLLEIVRCLLGVILAHLLGRSSSIALAGGAVAAMIGGCAIPSYFIGALLIRSGPDLLTGKWSSEFSQYSVRSLIRARGLCIAAGICCGLLATLIGWRGIPIQAASILALGIVYYRYQLHFKLWCWLGGLGIAIAIANYLGVSNAALCAIVVVSSIPGAQSKRMPEVWDLDNVGLDVGVVVGGLLNGIAPAVSANTLYDRSANIWLAEAIGEGFALAISLSQRSTGKTALGAMLSNYAPNLNCTAGLLAVAFTVWLICAPPGSTRFACAQFKLPAWAEAFMSIGAMAWYGQLPGEPVLSIIVAAIGYIAVKTISSKLTTNLPDRFGSVLSIAPILLL